MHMSVFLDSKKEFFSENKKPTVICPFEDSIQKISYRHNMRTKKLNFVERNIEQFIENLFFLTISTNVYDKVNLWDIKSYKRAKIKQQFFL